MPWGLVNTILLLAATQGFFLSAVILYKYRYLYANRFLGVLLLLYSIILFNMFLEELGYFLKYPQLLFIQFGLPFLVGPLHFLYAKYLSRSLTKFIKTDWLHGLLLICFELYFGIEYFDSNSQIVNSLKNLDSQGLTFINLVFNWTIIVQGFVYMFLTLYLIRRHSQKIRNMFSSIEKIKLTWLRNITYMTIFVIFNFLLENIFYLAGINLSDYFSYTSFITAVAVYAMGYLGLMKTDTFTRPEIANALHQSSQMIASLANGENSKSIKKYEKSGLSEDRAKVYLNKLINLMEKDRPYVDNNLTLTQIAEKLDISPHNLSEIINTQLHQNFFDFINSFRVEKAKSDLVDLKKQHLKILSIAYDAGFNSKSSFNTIFKKITNMTPSEYRREFLLNKQD